MNRVQLRGVIVSSEYDEDWAADYIARGIITPESAFRRALDDADPDQDVEIYVNSRGGSVFAGNEMVNAAKEWAAKGSGKLHIVVGALAASAAANFVATVPAESVRGHRNSVIMFHGAYGCAEGGANAARDYAELLDIINGEVKTALATRFGLDSDTVAEWFQEGRAGWINATEAKRCGLLSEIIDEDGEAVAIEAEDVSKMNAGGLDIAAALDATEPPANDSDFWKAPPPKMHRFSEAGLSAHVAAAVSTLQAMIDGEKSLVAALTIERDALTATAEITAGDIATLDAKLESATATIATRDETIVEALAAITAAETKIRETEAHLDETTTARDEAVATAADYEARLDRLTGGLHGAGATTFADWSEASAALGYTAARKNHPELYAAFMSAQKGS